MPKISIRSGLKHGTILGVKVSSTSTVEVLKFIESRLDSKEKFYILTSNTESILKAEKDWLLKKAIIHADISLPDDPKLVQALKFLARSKDAEVVNGNELFLSTLKIADHMGLKVYLLGGEDHNRESIKSELENKFKNITFKTHHKSLKFDKNGQPDTEEDRKIHKSILGSIKVFQPDLIFVKLETPIQEKWIYRNFFRLNSAIGAITINGAYEQNLLKRIFNSILLFPWKVFMWKLNPPRRTVK